MRQIPTLDIFQKVPFPTFYSNPNLALNAIKLQQGVFLKKIHVFFPKHERFCSFSLAIIV